jgi:enoyl-CoA hydratase/carnithine racemase
MSKIGGSIAETLLIEHIGRVAKVTLNRPERINAFDDSIRCGLPKMLLAADENPQVAAILLCGAGERGFCAGADIKESRPSLPPVGERRRLMPNTWIESLDTISKPVIALLHGLCLGGGAELALACDIRIAASSVSIGLPETALGLIPGGGGTQRLTRVIGLGPALDLLLTGERVSAERALQLGLVTRVAGTYEQAMAEALRIAQLIAERPPTAIAYVKEAARAGVQMDLQSGLRLEKTLFALLTSTSDRAEAAAAFREKRPPNFTGQ